MAGSIRLSRKRWQRSRSKHRGAHAAAPKRSMIERLSSGRWYVGVLLVHALVFVLSCFFFVGRVPLVCGFEGTQERRTILGHKKRPSRGARPSGQADPLPGGSEMVPASGEGPREVLCRETQIRVLTAASCQVKGVRRPLLASNPHPRLTAPKRAAGGAARETDLRARVERAECVTQGLQNNP